MKSPRTHASIHSIPPTNPYSINQEWREKRQSLEADNERLHAELHSALGRNTRLETESRRKDALLAEMRKSANSRAENISTFEAKLRHKDQLLVEAERDRKQAWQATSASAETAKAAVIRAEAADKEASDLRFLRGDAGGQQTKRTDESIGSASEVGPSNKKHPRSLTDVVMAAEGADCGSGGPETTTHGWGPTEASLLQSLPLAEGSGDRRRAIHLCPKRGGSADRTAVAPPDDAGQNNLGRSSTWDSGEGRVSIKSSATPSVLSPQAAVTAPDCRTPRAAPRTVFFDEGGNDGKPWRTEDSVVPSPSLKEIQEPTRNNILTPRSGRRMRAAEKPPPAARATGREQCSDGDRQRHDSEGVKAALTGANPAWAADAPSSFGGDPSIAVSGRRSSGGDTAGGEEYIPNDLSTSHEAGKDCRQGEKAQYQNMEWIYHSRNLSTGVDGRVIDEVESPADGAGTPAADESSPISGDWKLQIESRDYPAAGQRRGRDMMSSRRSSLSGAGVGVSARAAGEADETSSFGGTGRNNEDGRVTLNVDGATDAQHGAGGGPYGAQKHGKPPPTAVPSVLSATASRPLADYRRHTVVSSGMMSAPEPSEQRRKSTGGVQSPSSSGKSRQLAAEPLTTLLGSVGSPRDSVTEEKSRRDQKRAPAPFATDAAEDELRPVREVERRLMLLQMETSQVGVESLCVLFSCLFLKLSW